MVLSDGLNRSVPAAQEEHSEEQTLSIHEEQTLSPQRREDRITWPIPHSRLSRPFVKYRRPLRIMSILLLIMLIFALVHVSTLLSATDDQLLVRIGNQETAIVDLRQNIPISPYLFGANVFPEKNSNSLDRRNTGFMSYSPPISNGLHDAHIKFLRFPGGNWGEAHIPSYDQFNDFLSLLLQTGAEGMIQARLSGPIGKNVYGFTSVQGRAYLAAQWVDYMDNPHSSLRTGKYANAPFHRVTLWTVGNEPDLLRNPDTGKRFTVTEYTNDFIQFSEKMHQFYPAIQVFGPEISQFYGLGAGPTDRNGQLWMENFLKGVGTYEKAHPELKFHLLDGVSFHHYPLTEANRAPNTLLSSTGEWNYLLPPLRQLIRQDLGRDVPIAVTEINANPARTAPSPGVAALWWADTLGTLMDQEVEYVGFFSAEGVDLPYPLFTSDGLHQTAMFRVMQLFSHLQHNLIPVAAQRDPTSIYATQDDTHQAVSLLFVNKLATAQLAQVSSKNQFFGISPWRNLELTLSPYSIILVTLHRDGGAEAYSYSVPTTNDASVSPLIYSVCGYQIDVHLDNTPC